MGKWQDEYERRWKSYATDVICANFGRQYHRYEVTVADRYELRDQLGAMGSAFDPFSLDWPRHLTKPSTPGSELRHHHSSVRFQTPVKTPQKGYKSPYTATYKPRDDYSEYDSDGAILATQVLSGCDASSDGQPSQSSQGSLQSEGSYVYHTPQPKQLQYQQQQHKERRRRQRSPANAVSSAERQRKRSNVLNASTARSSTSTFPAFTPHDLSGDRTRLSDSASFTLQSRMENVSPIGKLRFSVGSAGGGSATSETSGDNDESAVLFAMMHTPTDGGRTLMEARTPKPKPRRRRRPEQRQEEEGGGGVQDLDVSMQSMNLEDEDGEDGDMGSVAAALDFNDASDASDDEDEVIADTAEEMELVDVSPDKRTSRWQWIDVSMEIDTESTGASENPSQPHVPIETKEVEVIEIDASFEYGDGMQAEEHEEETIAANQPATDQVEQAAIEQNQSVDQILRQRLRRAGLHISDDDEDDSMTNKLMNPFDSSTGSMHKPPKAASPTASSSTGSRSPPAVNASKNKKKKKKPVCRTKLPLPVETIHTHAAARRRERRRQGLKKRLLSNAHSSPECRVELAPYQREAVDWMLRREAATPSTDSNTGDETSRGQREAFYDRLTSSVRGGILADDMGLGKTVCCLALICESLQYTQKQQQSNDADKIPRRKPPTLIITPLSILSQWEKELREKTNLSVLSYHGANRKQVHSVVDLMGVDVVLSTYDTIRLNECKVSKRKTAKQSQEDESGASQDVVAMAEALNDSTQWHTAPRRLSDGKKSTRGSKIHQITWSRVILDESHVITNAACARSSAALVLKSKRRWCVTGTPIQNSGKDLSALLQFLGLPKKSSTSDAVDLHEVLGRVMLRRLKTTMDSETRAPIVALPPKKERVVTLAFASDLERAFYLLLHRSTKRKMAQLLQQSTGGQFMHVFELLLRLRQCCDSYGLVSVDPRRELREANGDLLGEIGSLSREDASLIERAARMSQLPRHSSKTAALLHELKKMKQRGERGLVVSQWTSYLDVVADAIHTLHSSDTELTFARLDGSMSAREREQAVTSFQAADGRVDVLLLSLRAGGLGLNLTAASCVFIMEPSWNPSVESQAVDRAHRVGQTKRVNVVRFVMKHTIEQRVVELQRKKEALAIATLGDGDDRELPSPTLTRDDLCELLDEEEVESEDAIWHELE